MEKKDIGLIAGLVILCIGCVFYTCVYHNEGAAGKPGVIEYSTDDEYNRITNTIEEIERTNSDIAGILSDIRNQEQEIEVRNCKCSQCSSCY